MAVPTIIWVLAAAALVPLGVFGSRGWLDIRDALAHAELDRLAAPVQWPAARGLLGACAALLVVVFAGSLGTVGLLLAVLSGAAAFAAGPQLLRGLRRRAEQQALDQLPLHLDLIAVALESGSSWTAALAACERAPPSPLRRAWERVALETHAGAEPLDALRGFEQRLHLRAVATLVSALRAADKLGLPWAPVFRERARQCAASRFARAEHRARAAPLKLWAALWLCLLPCTAVVLAFPVARWLAWFAG